MAKIDLEKYICSMIEAFPDFKESGRIPVMYKQALKDQGLEYKNGQIVAISFYQHRMYKMDYEIIIKFDRNGRPYWSLFRKGERVSAGREELEMVSSAMKELSAKLSLQ